VTSKEKDWHFIMWSNFPTLVYRS